MEKSYAQFLIKKTKEDYNLIAEDFSRTRQFFWDLKLLFQYIEIEEGEKILDLGCGNGRLMEILKEKKIDYFGIDFSEKLIAIAKRKYPNAKFQVANVLNLPFPNNFFDKIFAIRIFHHIPSEEMRLNFLKEAKKVLKPGGFLILTVWNAWGGKYKTNLLRVLKYSFLKIIGKSKLDFGDVFVPWRILNTKILRYFHFFTKRGLKKLVVKVNFKIKKIWENQFNGNSDICLIAQK